MTDTIRLGYEYIIYGKRDDWGRAKMLSRDRFTDKRIHASRFPVRTLQDKDHLVETLLDLRKRNREFDWSARKVGAL